MELDIRFWPRKRTPVLLQSEIAECGLVCVAMIAAYHGRRDALPMLRTAFSSLRGTTLASVLAAAGGIGLKARALKAEIDGLGDLPMPAILHWNLNHFVVLERVAGDRFTIIDPVVGRRVVRHSEFTASYTGICAELVPGPDFVATLPDEEAREPLPLLGRIDALKSNVAVLIALGLVAQFAALTVPYYWQWILDEALPTGDERLVWTLAAAFGCLLLLHLGVGAIKSWLVTSLATRLRFQWYGNVVNHLVRLPLDYFYKRSLGDVTSRFSAIEQIQHVLSSRFLESIMDGFLACVVLAIMAIYSPTLTIVPCVAVALYVVTRLLSRPPLETATKSALVNSARQASHFMETVRGMQTVRLFGRGRDRSLVWLNLLTDQINDETRVARLQLGIHSINLLSFGAERIVVIAVGVHLVLASKMTIGMLVAFIGYKEQFSESAGRLIDAIFDLRLLGAQTERLRDLTDCEPEQDGFISIAPETPRIGLHNVSFSHSSDLPPTLRNVSLNIEFGESICITGPSGCGKSTLARLLLGLCEPGDGEIRVNDAIASDYGLDAYRSLFGAVMQDDVLFAGTIEQNIHFFDLEPDLAWAHECSRMVGIHDEIVAMPMKYRTLIGDLGTGLSGGQKQRLFIARALYRRPRILVLDEATSHLDIDGERRVNEAIDLAAVTRIMIAHRPETIASARRVLRLENGSIVDDRVNTRTRRIRVKDQIAG